MLKKGSLEKIFVDVLDLFCDDGDVVNFPGTAGHDWKNLFNGHVFGFAKRILCRLLVAFSNILLEYFDKSNRSGIFNLNNNGMTKV